jgi:hypothetical protein
VYRKLLKVLGDGERHVLGDPRCQFCQFPVDAVREIVGLDQNWVSIGRGCDLHSGEEGTQSRPVVCHLRPPHSLPQEGAEIPESGSPRPMAPSASRSTTAFVDLSFCVWD